MVNDEFIFFDEYFSSAEDLLATVSKKLFQKGYVKASFEKEIIKREKLYPTGLKLANLNIAICHTEAKNIIKDTLFLVKPIEPVIFLNAEDLSPLSVDFVIGLALTDSQAHLKMLSRIAELFTNPNFSEKLKAARSAMDIGVIFNEYLGEG